MAAATCFFSSLFFIQDSVASPFLLQSPILPELLVPEPSAPEPCVPQLRCGADLRRPRYLPAFLASAVARSRNFAIVAAVGSFLFPLFCRRFVFVT